MQKRRLGANGPEVLAIGVRHMGMSDFYGPADRDESIATVRAVPDAGIRLLDTADYYDPGGKAVLDSER